MTLSELGSIGEFVGAIAVLATLIYLAMQIRQNSATTRAQIRQALADSQVQYINLRATDPFLRNAVEKMFAGQDIDESETFGLGMHVVAGIRMYENYFAQYRYGTMDPEDWRAIREIIQFHFRYPPYRHALAAIDASLNRAFRDELERVIDELDGSA